MKLKKKSKIILSIILIVVITLLIFLINNKDNQIKEVKKKNIPDNKISIEKKNNNSFEDKCRKIKYCDMNKKDRYIKYEDKNKDLSFEDIITRVNLNLDYSFYTNSKKTPILNDKTMLVNKYLYLDENYVPNNLVDIPTSYARSGMMLVDYAKDAFINMAKKAGEDGYKIIAMSSYRSYKYQVNLYNRYANTDGVEAADTYSARAGFSEHQTGLCVDIYDGSINYTDFEKSKSFNWMQDNSYKFGFVLRFPKDKENITGYQYESWHYRYVGEEIAKYIHDNNITFDEYYVRFIEPKQ